MGENVIQVVKDAGFVNSWGVKPEAIIPMPPSKQRSFQPVVELAGELAHALKIALITEALKKAKTTQQMKDVAGLFSSRCRAGSSFHQR